MASQTVSVEHVKALGDRGVFYRDPLASIFLWAAVTPLALLFLLVAMTPILIPVRLVCAAFLVALIVMTRRTLPLGTEITRDGVRIAGTTVQRSIPWADIGRFRAFELVRTPLMQGRKMRWRTGETRDIMGVLDAELAASRSTGPGARG
jgi:hypothetical protein